MKKIEEMVRITKPEERPAYVTISNITPSGFQIFTIKDETFDKGSVDVEYTEVPNFIQKIQEVWELHLKVNGGE